MANQATGSLKYAAIHNMEIAKTYGDHGRTGLDLTRRTGLQQLLADSVAACIDFKSVLVCDCSRWGRFQNSDEAASLKYRLLRADILLYYCAEQLPNDGSTASSIFRTLKQGMAVEYSRELSIEIGPVIAKVLN
jgi:DNA invertase Pin-like site-specific DNA recombinase